MLKKYDLNLTESPVILMLALVLALALLPGCSKAKKYSPLVPVSLRCEYNENPLGIDVKQPALSWQADCSDPRLRNQKQSTYEILVASTTDLIEADKGDLWSSGEIVSDQNTLVIYVGAPLQNSQRCYWKVRIRDDEGRLSRWSEPAFWTMGLQPSGWAGGWIGAAEHESGDSAGLFEGHEVVLLRREMNVRNRLRSAMVHISGLGYYELYINGEKAGDQVLSPGFTDYSKRVLYNSFEVSASLIKGTNAIGVILGGGWYNTATPDAWGFEKAPWVDRPKMIFNMILEYDDGSKEIMASDTSWKWSTGPIVFNCVRGGEIIDARLEQAGWDKTGFDDTGWKAAAAARAPEGILVSEQAPPIRIDRYIEPIEITEPQPGVYVFDMGVNISGWARIEAEGNPGDTISLLYNEGLNPDGTVRYGAHTWWHFGPYQTEKFILRGEGKEIFEPRFTYHGFRYIQVDGLKEKPAMESLKAAFVHTDVQTAGGFSCSNPDINKVQELIIRTQLNNLHSIPTDCPHREKIGWLGDGVVTQEEAMYNFDMAAFYIKWYKDILDSQESNGHIPPIVPNSGWIHSTSMKHPEGVVPAFSDPWWGGAVILIPWNIYQYYGDLRPLEKGYGAMTAFMDWLGRVADDHIVWANLADWIEPACFSDEQRTPQDLVGTAEYYYLAKLMAEISSLSGKRAEAEKYNQLAGSVREKFNEKFLDPETGFYAGGTQLSQVLPLAFGLAPEGMEGLIEQQLIHNIKVKNNNHLNTGFVGTPLMFRLLTDLGYGSLAYIMATREDQPGWFYMLRNGATTIWEVWDAIAQSDHSQNHPAFGSIGAWYYQSLAGIRPDPSAPGFKKFIIRPGYETGLSWAKAGYNSVHGKISSSWEKDNDRFILDIVVPLNTTATVYIPSGSIDEITEGGMPVKEMPDLRFLRQEKDFFIFEAGSGNYHFESQPSTHT